MASSEVGHNNLGFVPDPADVTPANTTASPVTEAFTNISLDESSVRDPENPPNRKKKKVPRRILHFSDGILEEYSTDEESADDDKRVPAVDPKKLPWLPWIWYYLATAASSTLYVADTCGEKLAWFFGITSPKYQYAIDEFYKMKAEEGAEKITIGRKKQDQELQTLHNTEEHVDTVPEIAIIDKTQSESKY